MNRALFGTARDPATRQQREVGFGQLLHGGRLRTGDPQGPGARALGPDATGDEGRWGQVR